MSDSHANDDGQRRGVIDEDGLKEVRGQEEKRCGVKHTSNEMLDTLNEEKEAQITAQDEGRSISDVKDVSDHVIKGEIEEKEIKDSGIQKTVQEEKVMRNEGGYITNETSDRLNSKEEGEEHETTNDNNQKTTKQKEEINQEAAQALNELSDSSEMSGSVSESSQSSGRLSPTLFLPEARVRLPKKTTEEVNKPKKKKEKRKLKLSEMDPEDLILRASEKGRFDLVEYSLNKNGSLHECQDQDGYTPLHRASYEGHLKIVELLVLSGANIGARTTDGWEPLHSACRWGQKDVALYLLENGANINAKTNGNQTPLHLAALGINGCETLQLLLSNKLLDRTITNNQGETAEDVAKRCGKWVELFKT